MFYPWRSTGLFPVLIIIMIYHHRYHHRRRRHHHHHHHHHHPLYSARLVTMIFSIRSLNGDSIMIPPPPIFSLLCVDLGHDTGQTDGQTDD